MTQMGVVMMWARHKAAAQTRGGVMSDGASLYWRQWKIAEWTEAGPTLYRGLPPAHTIRSLHALVRKVFIERNIVWQIRLR